MAPQRGILWALPAVLFLEYASANLCACDVFLANATAATEAVCYGDFTSPSTTGRWCLPANTTDSYNPCRHDYLEDLLEHDEFLFYAGEGEYDFPVCYIEAQTVPACTCNSYGNAQAAMRRQGLLCAGTVPASGSRDDYDVCSIPDEALPSNDPMFCDIAKMMAEADSGQPTDRLSVVPGGSVFKCWQGDDEQVEDVLVWDPDDPLLYIPWNLDEGVYAPDGTSYDASRRVLRWVVSEETRINPALDCALAIEDEPMEDDVYLGRSQSITFDNELWEPYIGNGWIDVPCDTAAQLTCNSGKGVDMASHARKQCCSTCAVAGEIKYARTLLVSESNEAVDLLLGYADGILAWFNGVEILSATNCGCYSEAQFLMSVNLRIGYNELIIKTTDADANQWGFVAGFPFNDITGSSQAELYLPEQITKLTNHGEFTGPGIDFGVLVAWVVSRPLEVTFPDCASLSGSVIVAEPGDVAYLGNSTLFQEYYFHNSNMTAPCSYDGDTCAPPEGVDLSAHFAGRCCTLPDETCTGGNAIAYARTYLYSAREQSVTFNLKQSDAVIVWIDSALVHTSPAGCQCMTDAGALTSFTTTLNYGWNEVVLKTANVESIWAFKLQITTADAWHLISAHHYPFNAGENAEPDFMYNDDMNVIRPDIVPSFDQFNFSTGFNLGGEDIVFPGPTLFQGVGADLQGSSKGVDIVVTGASVFDYADTVAYSNVAILEISTVLQTGVESASPGETITITISGLFPESIYLVGLVFDEINITNPRGFSVSIQNGQEDYLVPYYAEWAYRGNVSLGAANAAGGAGSVVDYITMSDAAGEIVVKLGETYPTFLSEISTNAFVNSIVIEGNVVPPTQEPSVQPSSQPSGSPSSMPSVLPSQEPSEEPSSIPSMEPSALPTQEPSRAPSSVPSAEPSGNPSAFPTVVASSGPTGLPTALPSTSPSNAPSASPSQGPTAASCVDSVQSGGETDVDCGGGDCPRCTLGKMCVVDNDCVSRLCTSNICVSNPSAAPSWYPSLVPTILPSLNPSVPPSTAPSTATSDAPSTSPSVPQSMSPSTVPSGTPSIVPSLSPSEMPTMAQPSVAPTSLPSVIPSEVPSMTVSSSPTSAPTIIPSGAPSMQPEVFVKAVISNLPAVLDTCQNITVDGSQSFGVDLDFNWILLADFGGGMFNAVASASGSSLFNVDAALLEQYSGSSMRVYLSVFSDFNGAFSSTTQEVFISANAVPLVTIDGGGFIVIDNSDGPLRITGRATLPSCGDSNATTASDSAIAYAWFIEPEPLPGLAGPDPGLTVESVGVVAGGPTLQIPAVYFSPGWVYLITLNATLIDAVTSAPLSDTGMASVVLEMVRGSLEARIVAGQYFEVPAQSTTTLTCAGEDPDYTAIAVEYSWSCHANSGGSSADALDVTSIGNTLSVNPTVEAIDESYTCVCTVSAGLGANPIPDPEFAEAVIEVYEPPVVPAPEVSLVVVRNGELPEFESLGVIVLPGDWVAVIAFVSVAGEELGAPTANLTVSWTLSTGNTVTPLASSDFSVNFGPSSFSPGEVYFVTLTVTPVNDGGLSRSSQARTRLRVNDGPSGGRVVFALGNAGLVEGTDVAVSDPITTEVRITLVDAEDPDGIVAFDFFLLGCDPDPDTSGDDVVLSGDLVGLSATLSLGGKSNTLDAFLPRPLSICPELVDSDTTEDAVADWIVLGVNAYDSFGSATLFTGGILVERATPSPTRSPTEAVSLAPTVVNGSRSPTGPPVATPTIPVDCKTAKALELQAIGNADGMLTYLWLLTLELADSDKLDFCVDELVALMVAALDLALNDSVEVGCQAISTLLLFASELDVEILGFILDLLSDLLQDVSSGLDEAIDYDVLGILECSLTALEEMDEYVTDGSPEEAQWLEIYTSAIDVLGLQLLRQMTPGQDPFVLSGNGQSIGTTAYVQIASTTDGSTVDFSDAGLTLPPTLSSAVEVVHSNCPVEDSSSGVVDLGLIGATRRGPEAGFGRTLTLSMTTCGGSENIIGTAATAGLNLSLALDPGDVVNNTSLLIVDVNGNSGNVSVDLSASISLECEEQDDSSPYVVSGLCPGSSTPLNFTCDGVTAGSVNIVCPYEVIIGRCLQYDPLTALWLSTGCRFLGIEDSRAICDCQLSEDSSSRRLQDDQSSGSLDFGARFESVAVEAEFTFTEADNVTAEDAERAAVVLAALGILLGTWIFMVFYGHKLDRRERDKTKARRRNEDVVIRRRLTRVGRELKAPFVRERQREILGEEEFTLLGSADGGVWDYVKTLCSSWTRRARGRRERKVLRDSELAKGHSMRIRSGEIDAIPDAGTKKKRFSVLFWQQSSQDGTSTSSTSGPSSGEALYYDTETKIEATSESNPMHVRAGYEQFMHQTSSREIARAKTGSRSRSLHLSDSFSDGDQGSVSSSFSNSVDPNSMVHGPRGKTSSQGMKALFRMRNRAWRRVSASTEESINYSDDSKVSGSTDPSFVTNKSGKRNTVSDHLSDLEELESIVDAMDAEIGEMQAVRKNFKTALTNEHEVIGLFRYNPTDVTMDDFYNEQASAVQQSARTNDPDPESLSTKGGAEVSANELRQSVAGRGVWSQAQLLWTSSTRPQKATLLLLEVLSIMTIDSLFYTGSDDLIVSRAFWDDLAAGQTQDLAAEAFSVVVFALITAILALPPTFLAYGVYRVRRQMRAAEVIGRRVLLHAEDFHLDWELQLQPKNSAADYAVALLEALAILQLAQNMDDEAVVPLRRHAAALEVLRNRVLAKEMNNAADVAAARKTYEEGLGHRDSALNITNQSMWVKRRRAAAKARRDVARAHEEDVRDGLAVLMTEAECQRVRMEEAAARVLGIVEHVGSGNEADIAAILAADLSLGSPPSEEYGAVLDGEQRKSAMSAFQPSLSQLYEDWVSIYSRPSVYQMARMYACPEALQSTEYKNKKAGKSGLAGMGKAKKKLVLAAFYIAQGLWGAFCIAYIVLFALTRSEVATAWLLSFIVATIFEILYVSPIIILFARVLFPATVGQILMQGLDKAKIFLATGSETFRRARKHVHTNWRAGNSS